MTNKNLFAIGGVLLCGLTILFMAGSGRTPRNGQTRTPCSVVLIFLVYLGARATWAICRRRADLLIEGTALRQQVTSLKKERSRPPLDDTDRTLSVALRQSWPAWAS